MLVYVVLVWLGIAAVGVFLRFAFEQPERVGTIVGWVMALATLGAVIFAAWAALHDPGGFDYY